MSIGKVIRKAVIDRVVRMGILRKPSVKYCFENELVAERADSDAKQHLAKTIQPSILGISGSAEYRLLASARVSPRGESQSV
jgi:hypothetical protein